MTNSPLIAMIDDRILTHGEEIKDFRGSTHVFKYATRLPTPGRSGKVATDRGEFYHTVFPGLTVQENIE